MRGKKDCFIYVKDMAMPMTNKRCKHCPYYPLVEILFIKRDTTFCSALITEGERKTLKIEKQTNGEHKSELHER